MLGGYIYENLDELIEYLNEREVLNENITELYNNWKLYDYLNDLNEDQRVFDAQVLKINKNGIKFYIPTLGYDNFILNHNILKKIIWNIDNENNILIGSDKKKENNYILKEGTDIKVEFFYLNMNSKKNIVWKVKEIITNI